LIFFAARYPRCFSELPRVHQYAELDEHPARRDATETGRVEKEWRAGSASLVHRAAAGGMLNSIHC